jgi:hypothetical protein
MNYSSPFLSHGLNLGVLVYATIIHDNHGIGSWIRLHVVKKPSNEVTEGVGAKRTLNNLTVKNPIIQGNGWKDRETVVCQYVALNSCTKTNRRPCTKKALRWAFVPWIDQARPR